MQVTPIFCLFSPWGDYRTAAILANHGLLLSTLAERASAMPSATCKLATQLASSEHSDDSGPGTRCRGHVWAYHLQGRRGPALQPCQQLVDCSCKTACCFCCCATYPVGSKIGLCHKGLPFGLAAGGHRPLNQASQAVCQLPCTAVPCSDRLSLLVQA